MPHRVLRLRVLLCVSLTSLLLALVLSFMVATPSAHADSFGCGNSVPIVGQASGHVVIGRVTKACISGWSYSYVESYLSSTTQITAWMNYPNNTGTTHATNTSVLASQQIDWVAYPACGAIAGYRGSISDGGSACTPL